MGIVKRKLIGNKFYNHHKSAPVWGEILFEAMEPIVIAIAIVVDNEMHLQIHLRKLFESTA